MALVPLTKGKTAIVDDSDFPAVAVFKWHAGNRGKRWYAFRHAARSDGSMGTIGMHQQIMGTFDSKNDVDHIDHDGLNNRRSNLRVCDRRNNLRNMRKRDGCSSSYKGVSLYQGNRWRAYIKFGGKRRHLGSFGSAEEAAVVYNQAATALFGEYACLNEVAG